MRRCITCNLLKGSTQPTSATPLPPPCRSDVGDREWEGPEVPPAAARTSQLRPLLQTVAACFATELVALAGKYFSRCTSYFSIFPDTESRLFSQSCSTFSPKHDAYWHATKDYFDQSVYYQKFSFLFFFLIKRIMYHLYH